VEEYQLADVVVLVSKYEGFGLPVIEAQAMGKPVLASDRCSLSEICGESALIVDPDNIDDIRQGILRLISDPDLRQSLAHKGRQNILRFSKDKIVRQYMDAYHIVSSFGKPIGN
jgi:glycosyltransferase involved in cell wall biosynthesis